MNRLHALFRRVSVVAAGALLGLTGVALVASPASAHHSVVKATADCDTDTGEWVVTWTIDSVAPPGVDNYKLVKVVAKTYVGDKAADVTIPGIAVTNGKNYPHSVNTPLTAEQRLDNTVTKARLAVRAKWENGKVERGLPEKTVELGGTCDQKPPAPTSPKPTASVVSDCEGVVTVTLNNAADATAKAKFLVTDADGSTQKANVKPGESTSVQVPAEKATTIKVQVKGIDEPLFDGKPAPADNCVEPGEPTGTYQSTCDELIFEVNNPADGEIVTTTFTPNMGEPQTLTVEPGQSGTVSFPGEEGLTVTPSGDGLEDPEPIAWTKPEDCAPGSGGGEPGLPLTGAAAGGIAAGAMVLLAVGGGLFVMARRRKLRFTA